MRREDRKAQAARSTEHTAQEHAEEVRQRGTRRNWSSLHPSRRGKRGIAWGRGRTAALKVHARDGCGMGAEDVF